MADDKPNDLLTRRAALRAAGLAAAGTLAGCEGDSSGEVGLYDNAGKDNYNFRPVSFADYCVDNVVRKFEAIDFGRDRGENFYSHDVGLADRGHMQGVARLPGDYLIQSASKRFFVSHFPGAGSGHDTWKERPEESESILPAGATRDHVGGVHAYHNTIVVPGKVEGDQIVSIYTHHPGDESTSLSGGLELISTFDVTEYQGAAHYASILPIVDGEWLFAVGHDGRRRWSTHKIHFYIIPSIHAEQSEMRYLGHWGRGKTIRDFQSLSLIAGCDTSIYLIGTGVRRAAVNAHAKLYEIMRISRSDGKTPEVAVNKRKERSPNSERNDCNFNAGATFFPTTTGGLAMYCTEKEIRQGSVTTREYYNEDA